MHIHIQMCIYVYTYIHTLLYVLTNHDVRGSGVSEDALSYLPIGSLLCR